MEDKRLRGASGVGISIRLHSKYYSAIIYAVDQTFSHVRQTPGHQSRPLLLSLRNGKFFRNIEPFHHLVIAEVAQMRPSKMLLIFHPSMKIQS